MSLFCILCVYAKEIFIFHGLFIAADPLVATKWLPFYWKSLILTNNVLFVKRLFNSNYFFKLKSPKQILWFRDRKQSPLLYVASPLLTGWHTKVRAHSPKLATCWRPKLRAHTPSRHSCRHFCTRWQRAHTPNALTACSRPKLRAHIRNPSHKLTKRSTQILRTHTLTTQSTPQNQTVATPNHSPNWNTIHTPKWNDDIGNTKCDTTLSVNKFSLQTKTANSTYNCEPNELSLRMVTHRKPKP